MPSPKSIRRPLCPEEKTAGTTDTRSREGELERAANATNRNPGEASATSNLPTAVHDARSTPRRDPAVVAIQARFPAGSVSILSTDSDSGISLNISPDTESSSTKASVVVAEAFRRRSKVRAPGREQRSFQLPSTCRPVTRLNGLDVTV